MEDREIYKKDYDETFRDEQLKWFEERMDNLPESLQIDAATYTPNLKLTVKSLVQTLRKNTPGRTFSGYMATLFRIRKKLEEQGL